jgi:hypothetical protein
MAAVSLSDCRILKKNEGEYTKVLILSPSTMDANDTIDISSLLVGDTQLCGVTAWDVDTGDSVTGTYATGTGVLTIDAGGGDTDHTYAIEITFVSYNFTP